MSRQKYNKIGSIRSEGYLTLLLSNFILALTAGLSGVWIFFVIYRFASKTKSTVPNNQNILLVLGKCLVKGKPDDDYIHRLKRAKVLLNNQSANWVAILGGITGEVSISEATAGKNFLLENGVTENQILIEDKSRFTLENLQLAREMLSKMESDSSGQTIILISNRYHLARAHAMANGMKINHQLCAAEEKLDFGVKHSLKLLIEAYYLHWYYSGKYWSLWTNNKKWLQRIS